MLRKSHVRCLAIIAASWVYAPVADVTTERVAKREVLEFINAAESDSLEAAVARFCKGEPSWEKVYICIRREMILADVAPQAPAPSSPEHRFTTCQPLWWNRTVISPRSANYRGQIEPGSAALLYIEVWDANDERIATAVAAPRADGEFEVQVAASKRLKDTRETVFGCALADYPPVLVTDRPEIFIQGDVLRRRHFPDEDKLPRRAPDGGRRSHGKPEARAPSAQTSEPQRRSRSGVHHLDAESGTHHLR